MRDHHSRNYMNQLPVTSRADREIAAKQEESSNIYLVTLYLNSKVSDFELGKCADGLIWSDSSHAGVMSGPPFLMPHALAYRPGEIRYA